MPYLIFVKDMQSCHGEGMDMHLRPASVTGDQLAGWSVESYITGRGIKGYYLLGADCGGVWYWGAAEGEHPDTAHPELHGPCASKGEAIGAGEDWVEAMASVS